jgi:hypothetical protein
MCVWRAHDAHVELSVALLVIDKIAETAHQAPGLLVEFEPEQRNVENPVDGVVAREQHGSRVRHVLDADRDGAQQPPQRSRDPQHFVHRKRLEVDRFRAALGHRALR